MLGRNIAADGNATERTERGRKEGKKERLTREGGEGRGFRGRRSIRSLLRHSTIATIGGSTLRSVREIEGGREEIVKSFSAMTKTLRTSGRRSHSQQPARRLRR